MRIFVTGGTGFVGSHFVRLAVERGYRLRILHRAQVSSEYSNHPQIQWVEGNLATLLPKDFSGCDTLVHFATHSPLYPYDTLANCLKFNLFDTLSCFEAAREGGVETYHVAGTCFEYGKSGERYDRIPTSAPLEPTNSYGTSKAAASVALSGWASIHDTKIRIARIFQMFGEGEPEERLWPSLRRAALSGADFPMSGGEQIRDFTPVEFVAKSFIDSIARDDLIPGAAQIANIGTGTPKSLREFSEFWWKQFSASGKLQVGVLPYREGEVMRYIPEVEKLHG